jgi:putative component of membrane protein insertase Oxa1/YidC/SpoIIIJ protein YidD
MLTLATWAYRRLRLAYRRRHPDAPGWCSMTPTCSSYIQTALRERQGLATYGRVFKRFLWDCPRYSRTSASG